MANGNFIVHNGLQVGALTIDAVSGNITTTGTITTTGSGSIVSSNGYGGLNADKIYSGTSNVSVTANNVFANIAGSTVATVAASGVTIAGGLQATAIGNTTPGTGAFTALSATDLTLSGNLTVNGTTTTINSTTLDVDDLNITVAKGAASAGDANGAGITVDGAGATITYVDATDSWSFNKTVRTPIGIASAGVVDIFNNTESTSPTTGALQVAGGIGVAGNLSVGGNINITGNVTTVTFSGNSGSFIGNAVTGYGALYAGIPSGYAALPSTPFQVATNDNTYSQLNMQNINNGQHASSDYVITADNGTDSTYYADFGLASSNFTWPELGLTAVGANDTYLLGVGYNALGPYTGNVGNVVISSSNGRIKFASGGANIANVVAEMTGTQMTMFKKLAPSTNNTIDIGASGTVFATVYATTFSGVSTTAKYADLAENYQADAAYAPGYVLEFGGEKEVTTAAPSSTAVAGIVSTNPAHLMNGALRGLNVVAVALQGRVPCNVIGAVKKGDLMVSAGFGYAQAAKSPQIGQVIGKALENFDGAKGQIEVVVGRC